MRISTKSRYALLIIIDIASKEQDIFIPLKDIATRQSISEKYLENIIKSLVKNELIIGLRGKGGGYKLSKAPDLYTVGEILRACEEMLTESYTDEPDSQTNLLDMRMNEMWESATKVINEYFDGIRVIDLIVHEPGNDFVI